MLSPAQIEARDGKLTASRVACLMSGDEAEIMALWREMIGDPSFVEDDLSGVWPVQLGSNTEGLNLDWYERKTGRLLSKRGDVVVHPKAPWAACTLDAWDDLIQAPVECKHVGGREPLSRIIERYQPQLHWQMIVTGARTAVLSVIEGAAEPICETIERDEVYATELFLRAERFMQCVWSLTPPVALAPTAAPVRAETVYDFAGKNEWASEAVVWLETYQSKKKADNAEKALKALVPADAKRCHGHGIEIQRDRAGRLSLRESKQ